MDNPLGHTHMSGMAFDCDIAISGGGLNGTALALACAQAGLHVIIVDPHATETRAAPRFDGRSYALALTSKRLMEALGLWEELAANAQPILDITVTDGRAGEGPSPLFLHFDHAEIEEGPMGFMVEDRHLRPVLLDAVAGLDLTQQRSGVSVVDHGAVPGTVTVALSDGQTVTARLLVGADGAKSATALRAGLKKVTFDYDQTALVCALAHERPHEGHAHQFFMPSGPLAILPLSGDRSSVVWTESKPEAARINSLPDAAYLDVLRPRFGDFLGDISLAGDRFTYPLFLSLAHEFVAERTALLGDAAHRVHPIAGQGLNAGLKDVAALAEVLAEARRRGEDIGELAVLKRYQQWRRFDAAALAVATDGFNRLFSNDNGLLRLARDIGLGAVSAMPGLRRAFIREAAGLTGDVPKLMQGRPL
ncbi:MAG: FAD-dependent monooxygenase [Pseudomonadota bacterium]